VAEDFDVSVSDGHLAAQVSERTVGQIANGADYLPAPGGSKASLACVDDKGVLRCALSCANDVDSHPDLMVCDGGYCMW
jgi:hypothetical protein